MTTTAAIKVPVPLLNPNEPEAVIAVLHVADGQSVHVGDVLCELETTKSVEEVNATAAGWVVGLGGQQGDVVRAGELLCWIAPEPDWTPSVDQPAAAAAPGDLPDGLRITQPALALARTLGVDLNVLPKGPLVTGDRVRSYSGHGGHGGHGGHRGHRGQGGQGERSIPGIREVPSGDARRALRDGRPDPTHHERHGGDPDHRHRHRRCHGIPQGGR